MFGPGGKAQTHKAHGFSFLSRATAPLARTKDGAGASDVGLGDNPTTSTVVHGPLGHLTI